MTTPPIARQRPLRPADNPRLPSDVRWYLKLTAYVRNPITLRRKAPVTLGQYHALAPEEEARMAPALREYLEQCEQSLVALGFARPVRGTGAPGANIRSCFTLLENPGDEAIGFVLVAESTWTDGRYAATATFRSDFADGVQLLTTNSQQVGRTPPRPEVSAARFPEMHDAASLYHVHRFRVAERARHVRTVPLTRGTDPFAYEARQAATTQDFWVKRGYYERVGPDALRFTRRGAVLASLRGLFPWRQITLARQEREARDVMRRMRERGQRP